MHHRTALATILETNSGRPAAPPQTTVGAHKVRTTQITDTSLFFTSPTRAQTSCNRLTLMDFWNLNVHLGPLIKPDFLAQIKRIVNATEETTVSDPRSIAKILNRMLDPERVGEAKAWIRNTEAGISCTFPITAFEHFNTQLNAAQLYGDTEGALKEILKENDEIRSSIGTDTCDAIFNWIQGEADLPIAALRTLKAKINETPELLPKIIKILRLREHGAKIDPERKTIIQEPLISACKERTEIREAHAKEIEALEASGHPTEATLAHHRTRLDEINEHIGQISAEISHTIETEELPMLYRTLQRKFSDSGMSIYIWLTDGRTDSECPEKELREIIQKLDCIRALTKANGVGAFTMYSPWSKDTTENHYEKARQPDGTTLVVLKRLPAPLDPNHEQFYIDMGRMILMLNDKLCRLPSDIDTIKGTPKFTEYVNNMFQQAFGSIATPDKIKKLLESILRTFNQQFFFYITQLICGQDSRLQNLIKQIHIYPYEDISHGGSDIKFTMDIELVLPEIFYDDTPLPMDIGLQISYRQAYDSMGQPTFSLHSAVFSGYDEEIEKLIASSIDPRRETEASQTLPRDAHIGKYIADQKIFIHALKKRTELLKALTCFVKSEHTPPPKKYTQEQDLTAKLVQDISLSYFMPATSTLRNMKLSNAKAHIENIKRTCGKCLAQLIEPIFQHDPLTSFDTKTEKACKAATKIGELINALIKSTDQDFIAGSESTVIGPSLSMGKEISNLIDAQWLTGEGREQEIKAFIAYLLNNDLLTKLGYAKLCKNLRATFSPEFCTQFAMTIKTIVLTGYTLEAEPDRYERKLYEQFKSRNSWDPRHKTSGTFRKCNTYLDTGQAPEPETATANT